MKPKFIIVALVAIVCLFITLHAALATTIPCDSWQPLGSCGMDDSVNSVTVLDWEGNLTCDQYSTLCLNFTAPDGSGTENGTNYAGELINRTTSSTGYSYGDGRFGKKAILLNSSDVLRYNWTTVQTLNTTYPNMTYEVIFAISDDVSSSLSKNSYYLAYISGASGANDNYIFLTTSVWSNTATGGSTTSYTYKTNQSTSAGNIQEVFDNEERTEIKALTWHYLAFTIDAEHNNTALYLDGNLLGERGFGDRFNVSHSLSLKESWMSWGDNYTLIDQIRISNISRSRNEIRDIWKKYAMFNYSDGVEKFAYEVRLDRLGLGGTRFITQQDYISPGIIRPSFLFDTYSTFNGNDPRLLIYPISYALSGDVLEINFTAMSNYSTSDGWHYINITQRQEMSGKTLKTTWYCYQNDPNNRCDYLDLLKTKLNIPYYGYNSIFDAINYMNRDSIIYKINNSMFVSVQVDPSKSKATTKVQNNPTTSGTAVLYQAYLKYENNTRNEYKNLNETVYLTYSEKIDDLFMNVPNPNSQYRNYLKNKIVFDSWHQDCSPSGNDNDFINCTANDSLIYYNYGMRDLIANSLSLFGYGAPIYTKVPSYYGGNDSLVEMMEILHGLNFDILPYASFQDIYNTSYPFNDSPYIMNYSNGTKMLGYHSASVWSWPSKYERRKEIANFTISNITTQYPTNTVSIDGWFIDTDGANTVWSYVDRDADSAVNSTAWNGMAYLQDYLSMIKSNYRLYILTENFNPTYAAGYVDGGEGSTGCCENEYTKPLIPDYKLSQLQNKEYFYGGYLRRYLPGSDDNSTYKFNDKWFESDLDHWVVTQVGRGNAPVLDGFNKQNFNVSDNLTIKTYYMWKAVAQDYMAANATEVTYWNGSDFIDLSSAMLRDYDFNNSMLRINWSSGLKLYVNRNYSAFWPIVGSDGITYNLSPIAFYAENPTTGLLVYYNREYNSSHIKTFMSQSGDYVYGYTPNVSSSDISFDVINAGYNYSIFNTTSQSKQYINHSFFDTMSLGSGQSMFLLNEHHSLSVGISSPESERTYYGGSVSVSTSISSVNALSACYLSLDGGTNQSFDCSSADVALVQHMRHSLDIYAVDIAGYSAVQRVYFTSQASQGGGGSSGGVMPQPLQESNASQVEEGNITADYPNARIEFLERLRIPQLTTNVNDYLADKGSGIQLSEPAVLALAALLVVGIAALAYRYKDKL